LEPFAFRKLKDRGNTDLSSLPGATNWQEIMRTWWGTLTLLPFMAYQLHQTYWALKFNIFFSISYSFPFPVNVEKFLLTNFLLIVHEAGHTFFSIFGSRVITILGGSLNEILLPMLIVTYTIFNRYIKGTQFSLYLLGSAWFSLAFYAADGSQRQLPLIGNLGKESHDWYNLLYHFDMLESDMEIALIFVTIGIIIYLAAISVPLWFKRYQNLDLDLKL
jgi:hypothetical protein